MLWVIHPPSPFVVIISSPSGCRDRKHPSQHFIWTTEWPECQHGCRQAAGKPGETGCQLEHQHMKDMNPFLKMNVGVGAISVSNRLKWPSGGIQVAIQSIVLDLKDGQHAWLIELMKVRASHAQFTPRSYWSLFFWTPSDFHQNMWSYRHCSGFLRNVLAALQWSNDLTVEAAKATWEATLRVRCPSWWQSWAWKESRHLVLAAWQIGTGKGWQKLWDKWNTLDSTGSCLKKRGRGKGWMIKGHQKETLT